MSGESVKPTKPGVSIHSADVDKVRFIGKTMYYPHQVAVNGPARDFAMHVDAARLGAVTVGVLWYDPAPPGLRREPVSSAAYPEVWSPRDIRAPANQVTRHGRVVRRIQRCSRYGIVGAPTALLDMAETSRTSAHADTV